jgi:hypothetical protein
MPAMADGHHHGFAGRLVPDLAAKTSVISLSIRAT